LFFFLTYCFSREYRRGRTRTKKVPKDTVRRACGDAFKTTIKRKRSNHNMSLSTVTVLFGGTVGQRPCVVRILVLARPCSGVRFVVLLYRTSDEYGNEVFAEFIARNFVASNVFTYKKKMSTWQIVFNVDDNLFSLSPACTFREHVEEHWFAAVQYRAIAAKLFMGDSVVFFVFVF